MSALSPFEKKIFEDLKREIENCKIELAAQAILIKAQGDMLQRTATQVRRMQDMYLIGTYRFMQHLLAEDVVTDIKDGKRPRTVPLTHTMPDLPTPS